MAGYTFFKCREDPRSILQWPTYTLILKDGNGTSHIDIQYIYIYILCILCIYICNSVYNIFVCAMGISSPFFGTEIYTCPMAPAGSGPIQGSTASPNPVDLWLWRCHLHIELHPLVIKTHFLQWKMTWKMDENGPFSLMIIYDNGKYGC